MKKLKILHVIPTLNKGGAERLVLDICNELHNREDVEVMLLNFRKLNDYKFLTEGLPRTVVKAIVIPSISGRNQIDIDEYLNLVDSFKPNIIHSHLFEAEIVTRENISTNVKYVSHLHDNMSQFQNPKANSILKKEKVTNYFEKRKMVGQYRKCKNNFIAISRDTFSYFEKSLPKDLHRITLMFNAFDFERFNAEACLSTGDPLKLITVGSLVLKKNQTFLIDVVDQMKQKGITVQLDIIGEGIEREALQTKIKMLGLEEHVELLGLVDHVEASLQAADIYVHSALYEPFGLVLLEAMASGLPCVSLDGQGNRDIIKNGKNGFMIMEQDASIFADKLIELSEKPDLYQKISQAGQNFAEAYDIKEYVDRLIDYYQGL